MSSESMFSRLVSALQPEVRSFDYVPRSERKGVVWHQGPFWFMIMAELLTVASGFVGGAAGLSFGWSFFAIIIGVLFGTLFVAFHGNQGPHIGLPQMVQSRAQFGTQGLVIPSAMVVFLYIGFTVFDVLLAGPAVQVVWPSVSYITAATVVVILTWLVAIAGHDLIHLLERWLGYITFVLFAIFTLNALFNGPTETAASASVELGFNGHGFMLQFSVAAAYAIAFAVYVSDYTRYLPSTSSSSSIIFWVFLGNAVGMIWFMGIGALLIAQYPDQDIIAVIQQSGDTLFPGFGALVLLLSIPGLILVQAVNVYGATLTASGSLHAFIPVRPTLWLRVWLITLACVAIWAMSLFAPESFIEAYGTYVTILLYFLTPWTAVNLTDYYLVRKGHYAIKDIFAPEGGRYGRWQAPGLIAYVVGFIAMIPFFANDFYTGPMGQALGNADVSFLVGLPVAAIIYYILQRSVDAEEEKRIADQQIREVEAATGTVKM